MNKQFTWVAKFVIACFIIASVFLIYHQSFHFDFINFDDPVYVTDNPVVKSGINYESLAWAFGIHSDICMYYQPIAWISHMLDCQWFGLDPGKHHRTSVFIHGINAVLLFFILTGLTGSFWRSAFASAIFALHPVNTDAIVWISERKTVLSAFFWFLGMGAYMMYCRKPSAFQYIPVIVFFSLGLFTKPVMITFPCAMILMDFWPLKRISTTPSFSMREFLAAVKEKIPLFAVIICWSITPFLSKTLMANETMPDVVPYALRISNALVSYSKYVYTFFFPFHLSILYPYPESIPLTHTVLAFLFLSLVTLFAFYRFTSRPYVLIGWLWFAGTLFPTSGLILGTLWPEMADRWAYIPYVGLSVMTVWAIPDGKNLKQGFKGAGYIIITLSILFIVYLGSLAFKQTGYWKNSTLIFEKALSVIGYHVLPHQNIASDLIRHGDYAQAEKHIDIILSHEPEHVDSLYNKGLCLAETGRAEEALVYLEKVIGIDPEFTKAYILSASLLEKKGDISDAINLFESALHHPINHSDILYGLADLLDRSGQKEKAEQRLLQLISAYPADTRGYGAYADLLMERRNFEKALQYSLIQTGMKPDSAQSHNRAGLCYIHLGKFKQAVEQFKRAVDMDPEFTEAIANLKTAQLDLADLAKIYRLRGDYLKALDLYKHLLGTRPEFDASLNYNIACLYALLNRPDDSMSYLERAIASNANLLEHAEKDSDFNLIRHSGPYQQLIRARIGK